MNCEKFQTVACDLARNEIMDANERASALEHIDKCDRCGESWSNQRELSEGLRNLARQMNSLQAPVALEGKLLAAFRDSRVRAVRPATPHWRYWIGAAAAALLIAFGVLAWRVQVAATIKSANQAQRQDGVTAPAGTTGPQQSSQSSAVAIKGNQESNPLVSIPQDESNHRPQKSQRVKRNVLNRAVTDSTNGLTASTPTKEIATDFVALGYASELDLQDGGRLLRVELPRAALARFGLPVNMDRADERVKADLLVGADGLARAIRFVK